MRLVRVTSSPLPSRLPIAVAVLLLGVGATPESDLVAALEAASESGLVATSFAARQEAAQGKVREPLPLDVAVSLHGHNGRSPVNLSPHGTWVAHTVATDDTVPRDSRRYSATGFPFAEGDSRMQATITQVADGESITLGGADSSSWAAVWSPDGSRVAFYSDEGGEAGLWIWDAATRRAARSPGLIVRPFFGFEMPRWSPDGRRVLVKVLPEGMSVAEANALEGPLRKRDPHPLSDHLG